MIRNCFLILLILVIPGAMNSMMAQTSAGLESLTIKAGTEVNLEGLLLVPKQDFDLRDNNLVKANTAIQWPTFKSINTVYNFKNPPLYSGELGIFSDPAALNGNSTGSLKIAFSRLNSTNYIDYSIINESLVTTNRVLAQLTTPYPLGAVTAASRETVLTEVVGPENFFTPNGDGINDQWVIQDIQLYEDNVVSVFDRAGRRVFQMSGYNNSWDGSFEGSPLEKGTYYYSIRFGGTIPTVKGFITIIR